MRAPTIVKFIPGFLGAVVAYVVLRLVEWAMSLSLETLLFFAVYLAVTVALDIALRRYGHIIEHDR